MSSIPDTGPGLSGFLGHYLWSIYAYFPSSGQWDWVLFFLALGIVVHFAFLPYQWNVVKDDMKRLWEKKIEQPSQGIFSMFWALLWLLFFVWFFHTQAGHTFLAGRSLFFISELTRVNFWLLVGSALSIFVEFGVLMAIHDKINAQNKALGLTKPQAYRQRNLRNLYAGGGIFLKIEKEEVIVDPSHGTVIMEMFVFWFAHLLFPIWSVASLVLLHAFLISAILADGCRMLFVYIQHKQTFG